MPSRKQKSDEYEVLAQERFSNQPDGTVDLTLAIIISTGHVIGPPVKEKTLFKTRTAEPSLLERHQWISLSARKERILDTCPNDTATLKPLMAAKCLLSNWTGLGTRAVRPQTHQKARELAPKGTKSCRFA
jgi:hypothetical protein